MNNINHAGIEVSMDKLLVLIKGEHGTLDWKEYRNDSRGHKALAKYLTRGGQKARIVMEATGIYSLDLAIFLSGNPDIEVMVVNPLYSRRFAESLSNRSKNDKVDAIALLEYVTRMEFKAFKPPVEKMYSLRSIARKITSLQELRTVQKNQLHALLKTDTAPKEVIRTTKRIIKFIDSEIGKLTEIAMKIIESDDDLRHKHQLLNTIPGVAEATSIQILGEMGFYGEYLDPKKLVALAGLDPREYQSGNSPVRHKGISRRGNENLRHALYMPGMVSKRCDPNISAFSVHLLTMGKKPKQVTCAVMRKLIHSISGMFKNDEVWDGNKFYSLA
jgi:transposase